MRVKCCEGRPCARLAVWALVLLTASAVTAGCMTEFTPSGNPECGNGLLDDEEDCDDGNLDAGDGCGPTCIQETGWHCFGEPSACSSLCGDGLMGGLETCDDHNLENGDGCSAQCEVEEGWLCLEEPSVCAILCGDGLLVGGELCDGALLSVSTCLELDLGAGGVSCLPNCTLDVSLCEIQAECDNGVVEYPEVCDGAELEGQTCQTQGYQTGTLACLPGCDGFDTSLCEGSCGDDVATGTEVCDGADLGDETCATQGFDSGALGCLFDCTGYDYTACFGDCGDGLVGAGEACDGANLAGFTCQSFGYYTGSLACDPGCTSFDFSQCAGTCGDGVINGSEACDGAELDGQTCVTLGFDTGTVVCEPDCLSFDTSQCSHSCTLNCGGPGCEDQPCGPDGMVCDGGSCVCSGNGGAAQDPESSCDDGIDNDCDGQVDCVDDSCAGDPCGAHGRECVGASCQCTGNGGVPQSSESSCDDGHDNDCDGQVDCVDGNCAGDPCGPHGQVCSGGACLCSGNGGTSQSSESSCSDGFDNDCDGDTDCDDPNCAGDPCAPNGYLCSGGACLCSGNGGTSQAAESSCGDSHDNDCDGLTDCNDPQCEGESCASNGYLCSGGACICPGGVENTEALCTDGVDNDCDGQTDAADVSCCGIHGLPPCVGGCDSGLQECGDGNCWYCCNDGSENGICGTWSDLTPCSPDPNHNRFDLDCCSDHSQPSCAGVCDTGLQECGDFNCWYCCGDNSINGICGTRSDGITPCNPAGSPNNPDDDCYCGDGICSPAEASSCPADCP